jgi:hypothetical protein
VDTDRHCDAKVGKLSTLDPRVHRCATDGDAAIDPADGEELLREDDASVPRKVYVEAVFDAP